MREIEYRAWRKPYKDWDGTVVDGKMFTVSSIHLGTRKVMVGFSEDRYSGNMSLLFCDIELEQFTGLLDKNGTKIFEGDILRVVDGLGDTLPYTVFWSQENCAFDWRDATGTDYFYQAIAKNSIIIGNIHDNKLEDFNGTGN